MPRSASRSFAYFVHSARPTLRKSQPTCACQRPAILPRIPGPKPACGECGSPSRSAKLWCLRWSKNPADHRPLHGHRAEHRDPVADRPVRLVRAVREQPVETDRDPERRQRISDREDGQIAPGDVAAPEKEDRRQEADERNRHADQVRNLLTVRHVILVMWVSASRSLPAGGEPPPLRRTRGSFAIWDPTCISCPGRWPCSRCGMSLADSGGSSPSTGLLRRLGRPDRRVDRAERRG